VKILKVEYQNFFDLNKKIFYEDSMKIEEYSAKNYYIPIVDKSRLNLDFIYKNVFIQIDNGILKLAADQIELKYVYSEDCITVKKAKEMGIIFEKNDVEKIFFKKTEKLKTGCYHIVNEVEKSIFIIETNFKYFPSINNFKKDSNV
jgi:hypothetical protein